MQVLVLQRHAALTTDRLSGQETGRLEDAQVPARCWPRVLESGSELADAHRAPAGMEHLHDVPAHRVGQRAEHEVDFVELVQAGGPLAQGMLTSRRVGNSKAGRPDRSSHNGPMASQMPLTSGWV